MERSQRKKAVYIASKKLKQAKENVIEQLTNVEERKSSLNWVRSTLDLEYQKVKETLESRVELIMRIIEKRRMILLEKLELERKEKQQIISESLRLASELSAKTEEEFYKDNSLANTVVE